MFRTLEALHCGWKIETQLIFYSGPKYDALMSLHTNQELLS